MRTGQRPTNVQWTVKP
ncbi:hypothetical protein [Phytohabitans maris]